MGAKSGSHMRLWQGELCAADDVLLADAKLLRAVSPYHDLHLLQRCIAAPAAEQSASLLRMVTELVHTSTIPTLMSCMSIDHTPMHGIHPDNIRPSYRFIVLQCLAPSSMSFLIRPPH